MLANVASKLIPVEGFMKNAFSVELIFRPLILDNVTKWHVFDDDQQIINFLHMKDTFQDVIIDEIQHERDLNDTSSGELDKLKEQLFDKVKSIPKSVIRMEKFYDFQDKFKKVVNCKTNSSSMSFEVVNLGTNENPQNVYLGTDCTKEERITFIRLLKEYKDIFAWTYDDLKTFDLNIIQHTIPIDPNIKPFQQKLRKIHPNL